MVRPPGLKETNQNTILIHIKFVKIMKNQHLKIVGISDIHGTLVKATEEDFWPEGDVLCIAGDILPLDIQRDTHASLAWLCCQFYPWIESLPYEDVVLVAGNHDFLFETINIDRNGNHRKSTKVQKKFFMPKKLHYLEDSGCTIKGFEFWGSPWIPDLSGWAFYGEDELLEQKFKKIHEGIDVLITHCPPKVGMYGTVLQHGWNHMSDYGCEILAKHIAEAKPIVSIFGHVHTGDHACQYINGTHYCNVSAKDEGYNYVYEPKVIEFTRC